MPDVLLSRHWRVIVPAKPVRHAPAVSPYRTELKVALKSVVASQVTAACAQTQRGQARRVSGHMRGASVQSVGVRWQ